jgi:23S rRNA (guanosine2251-2'-O)-methyltransferase
MEKMQENAPETLVYGKNPVTELLKNGGADTVYLADSLDSRMASFYTALAKQCKSVVKRVPAGKLTQLCAGGEHQGVAARTACVSYVELEELLARAREKGEPPFLVLCDGVEDPHNLGAILRSALLCGAHGVVIPRRGGVSVTPAVMKSSAGAAVRLPVARVANMAQAIRYLKQQNVFVYCADMGGQPLEKTDLSGPVAIVLGSEGSGVSVLCKKLCDGTVSLNMAARDTGVDSFNVSVAAGIVLYDILRRRNAR